MISASKMAENFQGSAQNELILSPSFPCQLLKWKVSKGQKVSKGSILAAYKKISEEIANDSDIVVLPKLKSQVGGSVRRLLVDEGERVKPGQAVIVFDVCEHKTVMKEMCAECGADLRQEPGIPGHLKEPVSASVALVHNIPELRVSQKEAEVLATKDKETLLRNEKLVLLVDLDQTLIHTTTENVPPDMKDVYHFQLYGQHCWYHTKFRPGWKKFLEDISKYFELHIFTMGSRLYAHTIARMLDPTGVLFADRIRSRDESFDMFSKYHDLRALFPCDDSMVCIIDDREDIWNSAPNLVTVKPYRFFSGTGDINAPPGSEQAFTHPPAIPLHENVSEVEAKDDTDGKGKNNGEDGGGPTKSSDVSEKSSSTSEKGSSVSEKGSSVSEKSSSVSEKSSSVSEKGSSVSEKSSSVSEKGSSVSEKSDAKEVSEIEEESHEINHNEKPTSHEEKCNEEEKNNEDIIVDKHEETQQNNNEVKEMDTEGKDSEKENEQANVEVSKKSNQDVVDGNHIEDHDDYLLYLEEILRRIHSSFYEVVAWNKKAEESESTTRVAPDLRHIVPELRRDVLKGTNIVFTGVIPTNTHHENSQAWKIAKQFGANVSKDLLTQKNTQGRSKRTTHVVAARPGTEKACLALRSPHVRLVNPNWLWTCAERWEWVDERLFPVEEQQDYKSRGNGTPTSSRRSTPRRQFGDEINVKNNNKRSGDVEEAVEHITDENLRIVLNPFLSFSSGEMEAMDKEVEDLMKSSDEEDNKDDEQILGSVSSSSNSTENGDSLPKIEQAPEEDVPDGKSMDISKGKAIRFSTIKQDRHEDEERPKKRRKIDFAMGDNNEESSEGDLSTDEGSSGSNSGDDDGNNMAALLEAELIG